MEKLSYPLDKELFLNEDGTSVSKDSKWFTSPFGASRSTGNHNGLDIARRDPSKTYSIYAMHDGVITLLDNPGTGPGGNQVVVRGENHQTGYCHMKDIPSGLQVGDRIVAGQRLGVMSNTGRVSGPTGIHLHLTYRRVVDGSVGPVRDPWDILDLVSKAPAPVGSPGPGSTWWILTAAAVAVAVSSGSWRDSPKSIVTPSDSGRSVSASRVRSSIYS